MRTVILALASSLTAPDHAALLHVLLHVNVRVDDHVDDHADDHALSPVTFPPSGMDRGELSYLSDPAVDAH